MTGFQQSGRLLGLLHEYRALEKKRVGAGVTPLEYQRWLDLRTQIEKALSQTGRPPGRERRRSPRAPTRLLVQMRGRRHLRDAILTNVSHGGVFIATPFAAEIGTRLTLCLRIVETDEAIEVPCEVVSNNVDGGFSTRRLGMGVRFLALDDTQRQAVDDLFSAALGAQLDD